MAKEQLLEIIPRRHLPRSVHGLSQESDTRTPTVWSTAINRIKASIKTNLIDGKRKSCQIGQENGPKFIQINRTKKRGEFQAKLSTPDYVINTRPGSQNETAHTIAALAMLDGGFLRKINVSGSAGVGYLAVTVDKNGPYVGKGKEKVLIKIETVQRYQPGFDEAKNQGTFSAYKIVGTKDIAELAEHFPVFVLRVPSFPGLK